MSHRFVFIVLIVLVLSFSASAQTQPWAAANAAEENATLKKSAIDLLTAIAGQIVTMRSAENRAPHRIECS